MFGMTLKLSPYDKWNVKWYKKTSRGHLQVIYFIKGQMKLGIRQDFKLNLLNMFGIKSNHFRV